jgi:hypothetical protein
MHRAWHIEDIRLSIFDYLEPRDLARLAPTCKIIFDYSTDQLWKKISSCAPFLKCLPKDWSSRPLQPDDIERLDVYGSKVRKILITGQFRTPSQVPKEFRKLKLIRSSHGKSWNDIWAEIAQIRPSTAEFLPNVESIRVENSFEDVLIPLIGISGKNLQQLYIKYIHHAQPVSVVRAILDGIRDAPRLEYLFVRDGAPELVPTRLIQSAPLNHLRLTPRISMTPRYGEADYKKYAIRVEILEKASLEHLTLGLTRDWYTSQVGEAVERKYLPALKTLWLNLTTFKPEPCLNPTCKSNNAWTCGPGQPPRWVIEAAKHNPVHAGDCTRQPPSIFFEGLDKPELQLLNIKFPVEATGPMFLQVVSAAKQSCRLHRLTELALAGGGYEASPKPLIQSPDLRKAIQMLMPLPQLRTLRLSVAPNFLDVLDLQLYQEIADGLPALEKLMIGHPTFATFGIFYGEHWENTPLQNLAAFCSLLPNLQEVSSGTINVATLTANSHLKWISPKVHSLKVHYWNPSQDTQLVQSCIGKWFPNATVGR